MDISFLLHESIVPLLLFIAGIGTGVVSSISGGGGLIIMPLFLFIGLPPLTAIATQNVYSVPSHLSAAFYFLKNGRLPHRTLWLVPFVFVFGALGAGLVSLVSTSVLKLFVPFILILLAVWTALNPNLGPNPGARHLRFRQFGYFVLPLLALYDGFFGVSSTTFYTLAYLRTLNRSVIESTAVAKVFSATSSSAALLFFIAQGSIAWPYGIALALGGIVGAQIGARLVVRHGAPLVRGLVVLTSLIASLKLLLDPFLS